MEVLVGKDWLGRLLEMWSLVAQGAKEGGAVRVARAARGRGQVGNQNHGASSSGVGGRGQPQQMELSVAGPDFPQDFPFWCAAMEQLQTASFDKGTPTQARIFNRRTQKWRSSGAMLFGSSTSVILMKSTTPKSLQAVFNRACMWCHILCLSGTCRINDHIVEPGMYLTLPCSTEVQTALVVSGEELLTLMVDFCDDALMSEDPQQILKTTAFKNLQKQKAHWLPELASARRKEDCKRAKNKWNAVNRKTGQQDPGDEVDAQAAMPAVEAIESQAVAGAAASQVDVAGQPVAGAAMPAAKASATEAVAGAAASHVAVVGQEQAVGALGAGSNQQEEGIVSSGWDLNPMPLQVVHRMCLTLDGEGRVNPDCHVDALPPLWRASLLSFARGYRQIVWMWQPGSLLQGISFAERCDANMVLPLADVEQTLAGGVHVAQVKDVLQMKVLHVHGGFFIDLDVLWTGRRLPMSVLHGLPGEVARAASLETATPPPFVLMTEPDRKDGYSRQRHLVHDGLAKGVPRGSVALGVAYAQAGQALLRTIATLLQEFWQKAAAGGNASSKPWMSSVTVVLSCLGKSADLGGICASPLVFCPLPRWLTDWKSSEEEVKYGYATPCQSTIIEQSACVNVWERQWDGRLVEKVGDFVNALLDQRCGSQPCFFAKPDPWASVRQSVRSSLCLCLPAFTALIDSSIVHKTLGDVHDLLYRMGEVDVLSSIADRPIMEICVVLFMATLPKYMTESLIPPMEEVYCMVQRSSDGVSCHEMMPMQTFHKTKAVIVMAFGSTPLFLHQPGLPWPHAWTRSQEQSKVGVKKSKQHGAFSSQS